MSGTPQAPAHTAREHLTDHVVVAGCGRVGGHTADALGNLGVPRLAIETDVNRTRQRGNQHIPVLFGDAANPEILSHAALERARALIVTVADETASLSIVTVAHQLARSLHVIARASTLEGVQRLKQAGAVIANPAPAEHLNRGDRDSAGPGVNRQGEAASSWSVGPHAGREPFRMHTAGYVCSSAGVLTNITVDLIDPSRPRIREPV